MTLTKRISARLLRVTGDESLRSWWGIAYWEPDPATAVCAPIPLNWIIGWAYAAYWALMKGTARGHDALSAAYLRGANDERKASENIRRRTLERHQVELLESYDRGRSDEIKTIRKLFLEGPSRVRVPRC